MNAAATRAKNAIERIAYAQDLDPNKLAHAVVARVRADRRYHDWAAFSGIESEDGLVWAVTEDDDQSRGRGAGSDAAYSEWAALSGVEAD